MSKWWTIQRYDYDDRSDSSQEWRKAGHGSGAYYSENWQDMADVAELLERNSGRPHRVVLEAIK